MAVLAGTLIAASQIRNGPAQAARRLTEFLVAACMMRALLHRGEKMFAAVRRAWDWVDDHATKLLAVIGTNVAIGDVMAHATEIKFVAGDLGLRVAIVVVFAALFWRGVVTGRRGAAMEAQLNKPPDIP